MNYLILLNDPVTVFFLIIILTSAIILGLRLKTCKDNFVELIKRYNETKESNEIDSTCELPEDSDSIRLVENSKGIDTKFMEKYQRDYDEIESKYNAESQLISIMPMLGILGTVFGLIIQISSVGVEEITSAIGLALITTAAGISSAIFLKLYDSKVVLESDKVLIFITNFDKKAQNASTRKQLEKGNN